ncbi:hypothetical protein D5086_019033 [Populus alba]|uniref:Uncharacterized protein n=1 Tax=Populus alba TaxID=43335 RepID=A0ACC4BG63_POPAL
MASSNDGSNAGKKKFAIIGVSSIILVAMVVAVAVGIGGSQGDSKPESSPKGQISTTSKSIKAICQPTDYRETCEESLSKAAGNTTDPSKLVQAGFKVTIEALQNAINRSTTLKELAKDPMASQALDNCRELMDDAIAELEHSFDLIESFQASQFDEYVNNLKVWLSATITYQRTCLDGFENTTGSAGEKMKELLMASSQLTSNGLAMVDGVTSILKDLNIPGLTSRRLLEADDEFPSWINGGKKDATPQRDSCNNQGRCDCGSGWKRSDTHVLMIGDGPTKTKITGNLNFANGVQTFKTATVSISGDHFMAKDIGFENSAGAIGHQAVALRVQADMSVFYNCQIDGYQDTLYAHTKRQFYRDCTITGTIDFIFGDAIALFQNCKLVVRKPLENQQCIVTAQGRNETREPTGFVIQNCTITADPQYFPVRLQNKAYLGRPWRELSRTIVMQSHIDDLIAPEGWLPWMGNFGLNTLFYSEYGNKGEGAVETNRVKWAGIKKLTPEAADGYTAAKFLQGDEWIPQTGVPYTAGMISA